MFQKIILEPLLGVMESAGALNAFCINEKFYTYAELAQQISNIRHALQALSLRGTNIGLVANDDFQTYASILAIWFEGLAYVPLHPNQPLERNQEIIAQAQIFVVVDSVGNKKFSSVATIYTEKLKFKGYLLEPVLTGENSLAYILFTSGSTGKPKGVPIMRSNVSAFIKSFMAAGFDIGTNDRCLQCFDLTFDVSVQAFLVPLMRGACVYTIPHDQIKYSYVYGLMEDHRLTFSVIAPSMVRYLRPYFEEIHVPSMRYCILTAEASPADLIEEWSVCVPNAQIYNFYGPTEATIYCTYYKVNTSGPVKQLNGMLSIGQPMMDIAVIIIDEDKNILQQNQKGELCISGSQLTAGYWNNLEKNKDSFFEITIDGVATRFYKSGDLCYRDEDGDIMYSGRIDFQVKVQGYRIELGEVEHHARECSKGQNAIAIAFENHTGNVEIALFLEGEALDLAAMSAYLKERMPYYMIPTRIIGRDIFPLNSNGKVDRKRLKELIT